MTEEEKTAKVKITGKMTVTVRDKYGNIKSVDTAEVKDGT